MNVLVTGGAGFIGSHVVDVLRAAGHHVIVVDNLHTGQAQNVPDGVSLYPVDVADEKSMREVFEREEIHAISHQAALANVRESMAIPCEYTRVNVMGTLVLLELAREVGCRKIVFASTGGAVYGEGFDPEGKRLPFSENSWPHPKDNYGATKLSAEYHLDLYYQNYGLEYVALRYPNVYGPRQNSRGEAGVVAIFAAAMIQNQPTRITGDGRQLRDFTYASDIARANLTAIEQDFVGIVNLGTGIPADINRVHSLLTKITGYQQQPDYVPRPVGEVLATYLDCTRAKEVIGWQAEVDLATGLERTVAWFESQASPAVE